MQIDVELQLRKHVEFLLTQPTDQLKPRKSIKQAVWPSKREKEAVDKYSVLGEC